jgi:hypothetical protein
MKKIVIAFMIFAVVFGIIGTAGCSSTQFTDEERFAARANVTINYNIRKYLPNGVDYGFTSLEYYEEGNARVVRADCSVRVGQGMDDIVRNVFMLSDEVWYLNDFLKDNPEIEKGAVYEEEMKMWYIDLGDFEFIANRNNFVDRINARRIADMFFDSDDKGLLGIK